MALAAADAELKHLVAGLPAGTTHLIAAPGSVTRPPHLQLTLVDGAGYQAGLLESASTRQPGTALLVTRRRDTLAPFGLICLFTVAVLGLDVMTGSRLQLETPSGLSVIEAGRFYGIGNEALGSYGITALFAAARLALGMLRRYPSSRPCCG